MKSNNKQTQECINNKTIQEFINILKNNKIDTNTKPGRDNIIKLKDAIMTSSDDLQTAIQNNIEENFRTNYLKNNININIASAVSNGLSLVSTPSIIASLVLDSPHLCCFGGIGLLASLCMDRGTGLYTSWHNINTANSLDSVQKWINSQYESNVSNTSEQQNNNDNNSKIKPINNNKNKDTIEEAIKQLQQIMQIKYYNSYIQKDIANKCVDNLFEIINSEFSKQQDK